MSSSKRRRLRRRRAKAIAQMMASPIDQTWDRIGEWCSAGRRSAWMRVIYLENAPSEIDRIELRAGREGDDFSMIIDRSNPQLHQLYDLFTTMQFAVET